jgi:predicted MFS family arabinose efflux permease
MITVSNSTIVIDIIPPKRRGEGIGIFGLSMTLAMAIGPLIGIWIYEQFNFTSMFYIASILSFMGLLFALTVKYPKFIAQSEDRRLRWSKLYEKSAIPISVGLLILLIPYGGLMSYLPIYISEIEGSKTGLFFLILAIGIGISRLTTSKIYDRQGPDRIITFSAFLLVIGFLVLTNIKTLVGIYASAAILGFANGIVFPTFQAMVNNIITPQRRGTANSTLLTFLDLGIGGGIMVMGSNYQYFNLTLVFNIWAGIIILGWLFFEFYVKGYYEMKRKQSEIQTKNII